MFGSYGEAHFNRTVVLTLKSIAIDPDGSPFQFVLGVWIE